MKCYPYINIFVFVQVLKLLTDALLCTSAVRDDLLNEGSLPPEDHCRVCHKLGMKSVLFLGLKILYNPYVCLKSYCQVIFANSQL